MFTREDHHNNALTRTTPTDGWRGPQHLLHQDSLNYSSGGRQSSEPNVNLLFKQSRQTAIHHHYPSSLHGGDGDGSDTGIEAIKNITVRPHDATATTTIMSQWDQQDEDQDQQQIDDPIQLYDLLLQAQHVSQDQQNTLRGLHQQVAAARRQLAELEAEGRAKAAALSRLEDVSRSAATKRGLAEALMDKMQRKYDALVKEHTERMQDIGRAPVVASSYESRHGDASSSSSRGGEISSSDADSAAVQHSRGELKIDDKKNDGRGGLAKLEGATGTPTATGTGEEEKKEEGDTQHHNTRATITDTTAAAVSGAQQLQRFVQIHPAWKITSTIQRMWVYGHHSDGMETGQQGNDGKQQQQQEGKDGGERGGQWSEGGGYTRDGDDNHKENRKNGSGSLGNGNSNENEDEKEKEKEKEDKDTAATGSNNAPHSGGCTSSSSGHDGDATDHSDGRDDNSATTAAGRPQSSSSSSASSVSLLSALLGSLGIATISQQEHKIPTVADPTVPADTYPVAVDRPLSDQQSQQQQQKEQQSTLPPPPAEQQPEHHQALSSHQSSLSHQEAEAKEAKKETEQLHHLHHHHDQRPPSNNNKLKLQPYQFSQLMESWLRRCVEDAEAVLRLDALCRQRKRDIAAKRAAAEQERQRMADNIRRQAELDELVEEERLFAEETALEQLQQQAVDHYYSASHPPRTGGHNNSNTSGGNRSNSNNNTNSTHTNKRPRDVAASFFSSSSSSSSAMVSAGTASGAATVSNGCSNQTHFQQQGPVDGGGGSFQPQQQVTRTPFEHRRPQQQQQQSVPGRVGVPVQQSQRPYNEHFHYTNSSTRTTTNNHNTNTSTGTGNNNAAMKKMLMNHNAVTYFGYSSGGQYKNGNGSSGGKNSNSNSRSSARSTATGACHGGIGIGGGGNGSVEGDGGSGGARTATARGAAAVPLHQQQLYPQQQKQQQGSYYPRNGTNAAVVGSGNYCYNGHNNHNTVHQTTTTRSTQNSVTGRAHQRLQPPYRQQQHQPENPYPPQRRQQQPSASANKRNNYRSHTKNNNNTTNNANANTNTGFISAVELTKLARSVYGSRSVSSGAGSLSSATSVRFLRPRRTASTTLSPFLLLSSSSAGGMILSKTMANTNVARHQLRYASTAGDGSKSNDTDGADATNKNATKSDAAASTTTATATTADTTEQLDSIAAAEQLDSTLNTTSTPKDKKVFEVPSGVKDSMKTEDRTQTTNTTSTTTATNTIGSNKIEVIPPTPTTTESNGNGGGDLNGQGNNNNPKVPRRFERFFHNNLPYHSDNTTTSAALAPVSQEEKTFIQNMTKQAQTRRRFAKLTLLGLIGVPYLVSKIWGGSAKHTIGSSAQLTASAEEGDASALSITQTDGSGAKTPVGFVTADVDSHIARYYDSERKFLGQETFVDFSSFERKVEASAMSSNKNKADAASSSADASTTSSGEEQKSGGGGITHLFPPPVYVNVPQYFPYAAIAFLWILPVMAIVNRNLFGGIRQAGAAAQKAGAAATQFRFKTEHNINVQLNDVAGLTEPKVEIEEIIDFMKNPSRYTDLGAKLPKGILLDGPPGTGKTMLAKAVAGESAVPMVSCSGSEFEEIYVGTGALRVRELFKAARATSPAVIFIDEIDTFGRKRRNDRGKNSRGTINALLSELDGFTEADNIIVLAATNRADILDEALTRSGRFDRKITIDLPPHKDRISIAKVHLKPLKLDPALKMDDVAETIASMTGGHSGADIKNICNEAAIYASRVEKLHVDNECFSFAMDRIMIGMEKKAKKLTPEKRERRAYHEAGKAVLSWFLKSTDPVLKVTISSRGGRTTGFTQKLPAERFISTQADLRENMESILGGYVAEEFFFHSMSTNAADDLRRVTEAAKREVITYGMHPADVGHVHYQNMNELEKPFGPLQQEAIDTQTRKIVEEILDNARTLLKEKLDDVRTIAGLLMKNETLTGKDLWVVLGDRPKMTDEFRNYLIGASGSGGVKSSDKDKAEGDDKKENKKADGGDESDGLPTADALQ